MKKSCLLPERMHRGHPVWAKNFEITKDGTLFMKCPETGRYFEMYIECVRYKCCKHLIWIEKDFMFGGKLTLDLTDNEPTF